MNDSKNLISACNLLIEDILSNESFAEEDLIKIRDKMSDLIYQLEFWNKQDNHNRFCYELKSYVKWILKNYS
tara:strand:- start:349 stop:564 length:216 start_codon:yes stop_codon:yes gene_type:complete